MGLDASVCGGREGWEGLGACSCREDRRDYRGRLMPGRDYWLGMVHARNGVHGSAVSERCEYCVFLFF